MTSQRPGLTPRGSQLSLISNDSSTSLLASRRVNGSSGLKQSQTTYDGPDSVEILGQILGTTSFAESAVNRTTGTIGEQDLELNFDFDGLSLRQLASSNKADTGDADSYRRQTTEECMRVPGTCDLYWQIANLYAQSKPAKRSLRICIDLLRHAMASSAPSKPTSRASVTILRLFPQI